MDSVTRLQPLSVSEAQRVLGLMRQVQHEESQALLLDGNGHVEGLIDADDTEAKDVLGDLDVHA